MKKYIGFVGKVHLCLKGFCKCLQFIQIGKIMPSGIRLTIKGHFDIKEVDLLTIILLCLH